MKKRGMLIVLLSLSVILSCFAGIDFYAYAMSNSGKCGDNVTYTFDDKTGELIISGSGKMTDYSSDGSPFSNQVDIKTIIIGNKIEHIGNNAFNGCVELKNVTIPTRVSSIGNGAFKNCTSLSKVVLSSNITSIGFSTFAGCIGLRDVYYLASATEWNNIKIHSNAFPYDAVIHFHSSHSYSISENKVSNCIEHGYKIYVCDCGESYVNYLELGNHSFELQDAIETTCTDDGIYIYECIFCGEIDVKEEKAKGHTKGTFIENVIEPTCTEDGSYDKTIYCTICDLEFSKEHIVTNKLGHNVVTDRGIEETCISDGLTYGSHCTRCKKVLVKQEIIPAYSHSYVITNTSEATCTKDGYNVYTCEYCGNSFTEILYKTNHKNQLYRTTVTCDKGGYDVYKCTVCSALTTVKVSVGHYYSELIKVDNRKLTYKCSRCEEYCVMTIEDVLELWEVNIINGSSYECPELDVIPDGLINAKDYAKLMHIKNFGN